MLSSMPTKESFVKVQNMLINAINSREKQTTKEFQQSVLDNQGKIRVSFKYTFKGESQTIVS